MRLRHYLAIVLALAVLGGVGVTAYLGSAREFGAMEVRSLSKGGVAIHRGNEVIEVGESPEALEPQDVVATNGSGLAVLNLESEERTVWLRQDSRLRIRSTTVVEAQEGGVLAQASGDAMEVRFDDVNARFSNAMFRVDRGFGSTRASTYEGLVRLNSPGEPRLELRTLFQIDVAAGDLPTSAVPYRLANDAWDDEHLEDVVALNGRLDNLIRGFSRQLGDSRPGLDYFAALTDEDVSFMRRYLNRPAVDLLVAFTIAENDPGTSFKKSFRSALSYLDAGASYGVAATILDVETRPLVAQLQSLIVDTGAVAGDGGASEATFAVGSSGTDEGTPASGSTSEETETTTTVSGGVEGESHGNVDDCSDVVECGVQDVEDQLPPGPEPAPEEEEDPDSSLVPGGGGDDGRNGGLLDTGLLD